MNKHAALTWYETHNLEDIDSIADKREEARVILSNVQDVSVPRNAKILDIGCGTGIIGAAFKTKYNATVYGIDLSKRSVSLAKKNGLMVQAKDINDTWPYQKSEFDILLGIEIIEHLFNPDHFLKEASRVLKKNGILILTTPNLAAWFNRLIFLFGYQPFFTEVSTKDKTIGLDFTRTLTVNRETVGHLRVFTLKALEEMLCLYGFRVIKKRGKKVSYLPKIMRFLDSLFLKVPGLAADMLIIARNVK